MRFTDSLIGLILVFCLIGLIFVPSAPGFIEREYTTREVVDACTHIVFGEVKTVDKRLLRGVVTVQKDVKGKSNLNEIKMNFAGGHYRRGTSPEKLVNILKPGMPIIVFYRQHYGIDSMCFVDNTWFQMRGYRGRNASRSWWNFTHIDPMMSRTFDGKTIAFQKIVTEMLSGKMWVGAAKNAVKVLVLTGNSTRPTWSQVPVNTNTTTYEYSALRATKKVGNRSLVYEVARDSKLPHLNEADILWLGYEEISSRGRYLLTSKTDKKIKNFVKNGGIVIVSGQDSTPDKPCGIGWLNGKLKGVESPPNQDFVVTKKGTSVFQTPNTVKPGKIFVDDAWEGWHRSDDVLATTPGGKEIVILTRRYGKGTYIITSLRNDSHMTTTLNKALMENILHYGVGRL